MTVEITLDSWIKLAEKVVAAKGEDYVYPRTMDEYGDKSPCLYVRDRGTDQEAPDCIIGTMLWELGIVVPEELEGKFSSVLIRDLSSEGVIGLHWSGDAVYSFSSTLQVCQDDGKTWGEALDRAKARVI